MLSCGAILSVLLLLTSSLDAMSEHLMEEEVDLVVVLDDDEDAVLIDCII